MGCFANARNDGLEFIASFEALAGKLAVVGVIARHIVPKQSIGYQ